MSKHPLTLRGADRLREELRVLKSEARPKVIADIAEARAHGDLRENAEYAAAKEQQGFIEGRIAEIETKLSLSQVIDVTKLPKTGKVVFGATVEVSDVDTGDDFKYQIVGEDEANSKQGLVSYISPIARALISKGEGDVVQVQAPGGLRELEIVKVHYV